MRQLNAVPTLHQNLALLEADPAFARGIPEDDRQVARRALTLPALTAPAGAWKPMAEARGTDRSATWLLLVQGVVAMEAAVGRRTVVHLLGPGDVIVPEPADADFDGVGCRTTYHVDAPASALVLGTRFQTAARAWPSLTAELQARLAAQFHRVVCQNAVLALPHVEDRLVAVLRLLASTWGRVRADGVLVPLRLTHDRLGCMTGARRPTVSLALGELAKAGTVARVPEGWLLTGAEQDSALAPAAADDRATPLSA